MAVSKRNIVQSINLILDNVYVLDPKEKFLLWISAAMRYIIMAFEAVIILVFTTHAFYDSNLIKLERRIEAQTQFLKTMQRQEQKVFFLYNLTNNLKKLEENRFSVYEYMQHLQSLIPAGVEVNTVSMNYKQVGINGVADTFTETSLLQQRLKASDKIDTGSLNISLSKRQDGRVDFNINFNWK